MFEEEKKIKDMKYIIYFQQVCVNLKGIKYYFGLTFITSKNVQDVQYMYLKIIWFI